MMPMIAPLLLHTGSPGVRVIGSRIALGRARPPIASFHPGSPALAWEDAMEALRDAGACAALEDGTRIGRYRLCLEGSEPEIAGRSGDLTVAAAMACRWMANRFGMRDRLPASPLPEMPPRGPWVLLTGSAELRLSDETDRWAFVSVDERGFAEKLEHLVRAVRARFTEPGIGGAPSVLVGHAPDQPIPPRERAVLEKVLGDNIQFIPVADIPSLCELVGTAFRRLVALDSLRRQREQARALGKGFEQGAGLVKAARRELVESLSLLAAQRQRIPDLIHEAQAPSRALVPARTEGWLVVHEGRVARLVPGDEDLRPAVAPAVLEGVEVLAGHDGAYVARVGPHGSRLRLFSENPDGVPEPDPAETALRCPDGVTQLALHDRWIVGAGTRLFLWDLREEADDPHEVFLPLESRSSGYLEVDLRSQGHSLQLLGVHELGLWVYDVHSVRQRVRAAVVAFGDRALGHALCCALHRTPQGWQIATLHAVAGGEEGPSLVVWAIDQEGDGTTRITPRREASIPNLPRWQWTARLCWHPDRTASSDDLLLTLGASRGVLAPRIWSLSPTARGYHSEELTLGQPPELGSLEAACFDHGGQHLVLMDRRGQLAVFESPILRWSTTQLLRPPRTRSLEDEAVFPRRGMDLSGGEAPEGPPVHEEPQPDEAQRKSLRRHTLKRWRDHGTELSRQLAMAFTQGGLEELTAPLNAVLDSGDKGLLRCLDACLGAITRAFGQSDDGEDELDALVGRCVESMEQLATAEDDAPLEISQQAEPDPSEPALDDPRPIDEQLDDLAALCASAQDRQRRHATAGERLALELTRLRLRWAFEAVLGGAPEGQLDAMARHRMAVEGPVRWELEPELCPSLAAEYAHTVRQLATLGVALAPREPEAGA